MTTLSGIFVTVGSIVYDIETASSQTNCDGRGIFTCPIGTCYTGVNGWIGCCSVSSCAARTTCIEYNPTSTMSCDVNTGGCLSCPSAAPSCVTIHNVAMNQYIEYCDKSGMLIQTSYDNYITTGSMGYPPSQATSTSSIAPSTTFQSVTGSSIVTTTSYPTITSLSSQAPTASSLATTTTTPSPATPTHHATHHLSHGAIAGIVLGCIFILFIGLLCLTKEYLHRLHYFRRQHPRPPAPFNTSKLESDSFTEKPYISSLERMFRRRHFTVSDYHHAQGLGISPLHAAEIAGSTPQLHYGGPNLDGNDRQSYWSPDSMGTFRPASISPSPPMGADSKEGTCATVSPYIPFMQFSSVNLAQDPMSPMSVDPPAPRNLRVVNPDRDRQISLGSIAGRPVAGPSSSGPGTTASSPTKTLSQQQQVERTTMSDTTPSLPSVTSASGMDGYKHLSAEDALMWGYREGWYPGHLSGCSGHTSAGRAEME